VTPDKSHFLFSFPFPPLNLIDCTYTLKIGPFVDNFVQIILIYFS